MIFEELEYRILEDGKYYFQWKKPKYQKLVLKSRTVSEILNGCLEKYSLIICIEALRISYYSLNSIISQIGLRLEDAESTVVLMVLM